MTKDQAPQAPVYDPNGLSALAYANGFTLWTYKAKHSPFQMIAPGYFREAVHMLRAGDRILANSLDRNGHMTATATLVCSSNDGKDVGVSIVESWPTHENEANAGTEMEPAA